MITKSLAYEQGEFLPARADRKKTGSNFISGSKGGSHDIDILH
jgi:hypothetical protein